MEPSTVVTSRRRHSWPSGPEEEECAEEGSPKAFVRATSAAYHGNEYIKHKNSAAFNTISEGLSDIHMTQHARPFVRPGR